VRTGPDTTTGRGKDLALVLAALGAVLLVAAACMLHIDGRESGAHVRAQNNAAPSSGHSRHQHHVVHRTSAATATRRVHTTPARPVRVTIPSLSVSAPVTPVGLEGTVLVPPSDPQILGWWSGGAMPGTPLGTAVITGHTVHTGGGSLDHLGELSRGARIRVATHSGVLVYRVTAVSDYSKGWLATHARRIFSQNVPGRLALVTCTDFNGTVYLSNTVVLANVLRIVR
jgi:LPXTG-site transpeptidase (sortase) family protein